ncbi:catalase A [Coemansia interrupta]|uniref:Catalase A n=1 Tax=Coemansia interrupta TaxID=1126814 RepID=A0A9W8H556_9FUNG|nr:catalase A [Coemansia interrupta]
MVPGIAPSPDRILQGRLGIYQDTQSHRIGPNYQQLPINKPLVPVLNHMRDGRMCFTNNGGRLPNYQPNSYGGPSEDPRVREMDMQAAVKGYMGRHTYKVTEADFEQPRKMFSIMSKAQQQYLIDNFAGALSLAKPMFQRKIVPHLKRVDSDYGSRIEAILKQKSADY